MRFWATATLCAIAMPGWAQEALSGAKRDLALPSASAGTNPSSGIMPLVQLVVALAIVLMILKWLLPKALTRFNRRLRPTLGNSIKIEESASFAGGMLYVVAARNKQLLICAGQHGVTCLADLTEEPSPVEPAFFELLDAESKKPDDAPKRAVVGPIGDGEPHHDLNPADIRAALERAQRLAG